MWATGASLLLSDRAAQMGNLGSGTAIVQLRFFSDPSFSQVLPTQSCLPFLLSQKAEVEVHQKGVKLFIPIATQLVSQRFPEKSLILEAPASEDLNW